MQVEEAGPKTWSWHWRIGSLGFRYPPGFDGFTVLSHRLFWCKQQPGLLRNWRGSSEKGPPPGKQVMDLAHQDNHRDQFHGPGEMLFFSFSPNKWCWFVSFYLLERFIEENSEHDMSLVHFQCSYMLLLSGMPLFPNLLNKLLFKQSSLLMPSSLGLPRWVHYSVPKDLAFYGQMDWELFQRCSLGFLYPQA